MGDSSNVGFFEDLCDLEIKSVKIEVFWGLEVCVFIFVLEEVRDKQFVKLRSCLFDLFDYVDWGVKFFGKVDFLEVHLGRAAFVDFVVFGGLVENLKELFAEAVESPSSFVLVFGLRQLFFVWAIVGRGQSLEFLIVGEVVCEASPLSWFWFEWHHSSLSLFLCYLGLGSTPHPFFVFVLSGFGKYPPSCPPF